MKVKERYFSYKRSYPKYLILLKVGSFYQTFDEDSLILHNIFNYKIINDRVGFPISSESKVLSFLNKYKINYYLVGESIIKKRFNDNSYDNYLSDLSISDRIDNIYHKLKLMVNSKDILSLLSNIEDLL